MTDVTDISRKELIEKARAMVLAEIARRERLAEQFDWHRWARPNQLPPEGNWYVWLLLAGRGFGKTRAGAETIRQWVAEKRFRRIALIGNTERAVREIMVEGDSGLLAVHPADQQPRYEPSKRRITWPNGAIAKIYSAEKYQHLHGAQFDCVWIDELAKFRYGAELWEELTFALRLGPDPRIIVTTTPKPTQMIQTLLQGEGDWVAVTRGATFDNAENLAPRFIERVKAQYAGTLMDPQEPEGRAFCEVTKPKKRCDQTKATMQTLLVLCTLPPSKPWTLKKPKHIVWAQAPPQKWRTSQQ